VRRAVRLELEQYFETNRRLDAQRDSVTQLIPQRSRIYETPPRTAESVTPAAILWRPRQKLHLAKGTLGSSALAATNEFYEAVSHLRDRVRSYHGNAAASGRCLASPPGRSRGNAPGCRTGFR
jgi:hypothetical protein